MKRKNIKKILCLLVILIIVISGISSYWCLSKQKHEEKRVYLLVDNWNEFLETLPFAANNRIPILLNNSKSVGLIADLSAGRIRMDSSFLRADGKKVAAVVSENITKTYNLSLQNAINNYTFGVPSNVTKLEIDVTCNSSSLSVIYPFGVLKKYGNEKRIKGTFEEPVEGEWEIKSEGGMILDAKISITYLTKKGINTIMMLANAPVLATLYHLPLKIIYNNSVNVSSNDVIIDFDNQMGVSNSIQNMSTLLDIICNASNNKGVVFASVDKYAVSAYFGAFNGLPVIFPFLAMPDVYKDYEKIWYNLYEGEPDEKFSTEKFKCHSPEIYQTLKDDLTCSLSKYNNLFEGKGYVISNMSQIKFPLDLAMQKNMGVGRFIGTQEEILLQGNKGMFFNEVRKSSDTWKKLFGSFVSYSHGLNFSDEGVFVSDNAKDAFSWLSKYSIFTANTTEILKNLNEGVGFWYHSSHGHMNFTSNDGGVYGWSGIGERSYEEAGNASEPDADRSGLVDPGNTVKISQNNFSSIKLKNTVCVIMACKIGSSDFPYTLLKNGASCVIISPVEVSFRQGGFLTNKIIEKIVDGETVGRALKISTAETMNRTDEFDAPFLCFGEPDIKVVEHKIVCEVSSPKNVLFPQITKIKVRVSDENGNIVSDADVKANDKSLEYSALFNDYSLSCGFLSDNNNNVTIEVRKDMCGTIILNTTVYVYPKVYRLSISLFSIICILIIITLVSYKYRSYLIKIFKHKKRNK